LLGEAVRAALYASGAARVDGRRLLSALRRAFERRGGRWAQGSAEVVLEQGRAVGVRTDASVWPAAAVAICGGAWSSGLGERLGLRVPVRPQRGQLAHLELRGHDTSGWPSVLDFGTHYLLSFGPNRIVAGATREDGAGYCAVSTVGGVAGVLGQALWLAPALAHAHLLETRVGLRPVCSDGMTLLGAVSQAPNLFLATGHAGYGLEVGPYSGALVAELILGRRPQVDATPFAPARFSAASPGGLSD
jgi:D-amino-acid dehydrogenase